MLICLPCLFFSMGPGRKHTYNSYTSVKSIKKTYWARAALLHQLYSCIKSDLQQEHPSTLPCCGFRSVSYLLLLPSLQCRAQITSCTSDVLCFVDTSTNKPSRTSWPWLSLSAVRHSSSKPCVPLSTRHDHVLWAARAACLTGLPCCWLGSCAKKLAALMVLRPGVLSCALGAGVKPVYEVCVCVCVRVCAMLLVDSDNS